MNIKEAKIQIKNAMISYFSKDEFGSYLIPIEKQRPVFLIGAPGIGKTAVMEQIAREMDVPLVSYSMTHHTRQSALGLPFISHKTYGGKEYDISEYTMSEIIASVYEMMEKTGKNQGILFLDEINCVSETLSPIMLQFLQYKVFGRHRVPEGWIVVTAGNPPEYNNSVHEFDIVTWDRLKRIDVEPEYECWREYALNAGIHASVLSYLDIEKDHFYKIESTVDGKTFVTARGWEDLSKMIQLYEKNGITVDENLISQYLQNKKIAKSFAVYYDLFNKYRTDYEIENILHGKANSNVMDRARQAKFDERLSLIGLLFDSVSDLASQVMESSSFVSDYMELLKNLRRETIKRDFSAFSSLNATVQSLNKEIDTGKETGTMSSELIRRKKALIAAAEALIEETNDCITGADVFAVAKADFDTRVKEVNRQAEAAKKQFENVFNFIEEVFADGSEMTIFVTELTANTNCASFIGKYGCDAYFRHNKELLLYERQKELVHEIDQLSLDD